MGNHLDKSHPFRSSIDYRSNVSANTDPSQPAPATPVQAAIPAEEKERKSPIASFFVWFRRQNPKFRILFIAVFGGSLCWGYTMVYDAMFGPAPKKRVANAVFFEADDSHNDRRVGAERPGWISNTFCRGVRRSALCD